MDYLASARDVLVQGHQAASDKASRAEQRSDTVSVYGETAVTDAGRSVWRIDFPVVFVVKPTFHFGFEFAAASDVAGTYQYDYFVTGAVAVNKWLFRQYGTTNYWVGAILSMDVMTSRIARFVSGLVAREAPTVTRDGPLAPDALLVHHTFTGMALRSPGFNADSLGETPVIP